MLDLRYFLVRIGLLGYNPVVNQGSPAYENRIYVLEPTVMMSITHALSQYVLFYKVAVYLYYF